MSKKFKKFPEFFIGMFLDEKIIGVIGGFPRGDYLLMSELAVDSKFQGKSLGKKLVKHFDKNKGDKRAMREKARIAAKLRRLNMYLSK